LFCSPQRTSILRHHSQSTRFDPQTCASSLEDWCPPSCSSLTSDLMSLAIAAFESLRSAGVPGLGSPDSVHVGSQVSFHEFQIVGVHSGIVLSCYRIATANGTSRRELSPAELWGSSKLSFRGCRPLSATSKRLWGPLSGSRSHGSSHWPNLFDFEPSASFSFLASESRAPRKFVRFSIPSKPTLSSCPFNCAVSRCSGSCVGPSFASCVTHF